MTDGSALHLLLIEDHPRFRQTLRRALELLAEVALVAEASDGPSALHQADMVNPHIVLCDVNLPSMSGLEVVGRLRDRDPTCPIIVLTVVDDAEQRAQAMQAGASAYVTKDSGLAAIVTLIRDLAAHGHPHGVYRSVPASSAGDDHDPWALPQS